MKKIYSYLHEPNVRGYLVIGLIFTAVVVVTILTWGK